MKELFIVIGLVTVLASLIGVELASTFADSLELWGW